MSEHQEQCKYFNWVNDMMKVDFRYENIYAIPNGSARSKKTSVQLKNEGLRPGVLDINVDWPCGIYHGLRIEMKYGKGVTSVVQKEWLDRYLRAGYLVHICCSAESAINVTIDYFNRK